jgi:uncharacterized protein YfaP (DUF2135 family)
MIGLLDSGAFITKLAQFYEVYVNYWKNNNAEVTVKNMNKRTHTALLEITDNVFAKLKYGDFMQTHIEKTR